MRPPRAADFDTIVAPATAPAAAAICLVRISGAGASGVARKIVSSLPQRIPARVARVADFRDPEGEIFDRGLITFFPGPRSYTGEDLFEFGLHGNPILVRKFLSSAQAAGARFAAAGEFSRRAFLNGKMSLLEAESVRELVEARTERAARGALARLSGALSEKLASIRENLLLAHALWTAAVDFPEQAGEEDRDSISARLGAALGEIETLARAGEEGPKLFSGLRLVIVGAPNAGKSTIFNRLLGHNRAIVTPEPGTTRDTLEGELEIDGVAIRAIDTAGLREPEHVAEAAGIERTHAELTRADVVLEVREASNADSSGCVLSAPGAHKILIINKIDLTPGPIPVGAVPLCALSPEAGDVVRGEISRLLAEEFSPESSIPVASQRQADLLGRAWRQVRAASEALARGEPAEIAVSHVEEALAELADLVGEATAEDSLERIFSTFCIGK